MQSMGTSRKAFCGNQKSFCKWNRHHEQRNGMTRTCSAGENFNESEQGTRIGSSGTGDDQGAAVSGAEIHQANLRKKVHGTRHPTCSIVADNHYLAAKTRETHDTVAGTHRGMCLSSTLAKWYYGCLSNFHQNCLSNSCFRNWGLRELTGTMMEGVRRRLPP